MNNVMYLAYLRTQGNVVVFRDCDEINENFYFDSASTEIEIRFEGLPTEFHYAREAGTVYKTDPDNIGAFMEEAGTIDLG